MRISLIGQGLSEFGDSVGDILLSSFEDMDFSEFKCIVAFASSDGVEDFSTAIGSSKEHIKKFDVVVGVDQNGTSAEALRRLMSLDVGAKIYFTVSPSIFHPKIYVFDGRVKCRIVIGSSNFTRSGLFRNIEAGVLIDFIKPDTQGEAFLSEIDKYFGPLFSENHPNIKIITDNIIETLLRASIITRTEAVRDRKTGSAVTAPGGEDLIATIEGMFPPIHMRQIPRRLYPTAPSGEEAQDNPVFPCPDISSSLPVWAKRLASSDVLQVKSSNTNPTGGLRLTQAGYSIDQTTYFRNKLFAGYTWRQVKSNPFVEVATIPFCVQILGRKLGPVDLVIRHKPSGEAGQHNYTTLISWGTISPDIRREDLSGRYVRIYEPVDPDGLFTIEIV